MRRRLACLLLLVGLVTGCTTTESPATLTVFAAASLTEAFTELSNQFMAAHPETAVVLNFAGSQQLAQQLAQGAPADIFASADQPQMTVAVDNGRIAASAVQPLLHNQLVIITPADNPANIRSPGDLATPGLKLVLAATAVPVGRYTRDFLANVTAYGAYVADFETAVLANVVSYEQNVRAVLSKVALGEADAGIVYSSDAAGSTAVQQIAIPVEVNPRATYLIAATLDSAQPLAQAFLDFVLSDEGQAVLAQHGFVPLTAVP